MSPPEEAPGFSRGEHVTALAPIAGQVTSAQQGGALCLDLGGTIGYAYAPLAAQRPLFGSFVLPKIGGLGARFTAAENELLDLIELHLPSHIYLEAPLPSQAMKSEDAARQQLGLWAHVISNAYRRSIPVTPQDSYTVRFEVLGTGRFPKGEVKDEITAWCRGRGWHVPDHHAADACMLWAFFRKRLGVAR
jgi:hypothetical protein